MANILVAEDTREVREALELALASEGHDVRLVRDGAAALAEYARQRPDLVLLDVMMPRKTGFDVCREIRRLDPVVPILLLTAKSEDADKVLGLGLGANDYITKPYSVCELLARVSAALRRTADVMSAARAETVSNEGVFTLGSSKVDIRRFTLTNPEGETSPLQPRELALLKLFLSRPGEVLTREELFQRLWGADYYGNTRTIDQHILNLRHKLGSDSAHVETVTRLGYRFVP